MGIRKIKVILSHSGMCTVYLMLLCEISYLLIFCLRLNSTSSYICQLMYTFAVCVEWYHNQTTNVLNFSCVILSAAE